MSAILLLETATEICSVGLRVGEELRAIRESTEDFQHSRFITRFIEAVLAEAGQTFADLSAVVLSSGPGSYTSLRVGAATAKGICLALNIPLVVGDTLESLARAAVRPDDPEATLYLPMIDARRQEVYTAAYDRAGQRVREREALVLTADSFAVEARQYDRLVAIGSGAAKAPEIVSAAELVLRPAVRLSATTLNGLVDADFLRRQRVNPVDYEPAYLKAPHVTRPRRKLL